MLTEERSIIICQRVTGKLGKRIHTNAAVQMRMQFCLRQSVRKSIHREDGKFTGSSNPNKTVTRLRIQNTTIIMGNRCQAVAMQDTRTAGGHLCRYIYYFAERQLL